MNLVNRSFLANSLWISLKALKRVLQFTRLRGLALGLIFTTSVYGQFSTAFPYEDVGVMKTEIHTIQVGLNDPVHSIKCEGSMTFTDVGNCIVTGTDMGNSNLWQYHTDGRPETLLPGTYIIYKLESMTASTGAFKFDTTANWLLFNIGYGAAFSKTISIKNLKPVKVEPAGGMTRAQILRWKTDVEHSRTYDQVFLQLKSEQTAAATHQYRWQLYGEGISPEPDTLRQYIQQQQYMDNQWNYFGGYMGPGAVLMSPRNWTQILETGFEDEGDMGGGDF